MKKSHKEMAIGAVVTIATTVVAAVFGEKLLEKARAKGFLGSKIAGEEEDDAVLKAAREIKSV